MSLLSVSAMNAHGFWDEREGPGKGVGSKAGKSGAQELPWAATWVLYPGGAFPPDPTSLPHCREQELC